MRMWNMSLIRNIAPFAPRFTSIKSRMKPEERPVEFRVLGDGKLLWRSIPFKSSKVHGQPLSFGYHGRQHLDLGDAD